MDDLRARRCCSGGVCVFVARLGRRRRHGCVSSSAAAVGAARAARGAATALSGTRSVLFVQRPRGPSHAPAAVSRIVAVSRMWCGDAAARSCPVRRAQKSVQSHRLPSVLHAASCAPVRALASPHRRALQRPRNGSTEASVNQRWGSFVRPTTLPTANAAQRWTHNPNHAVAGSPRLPPGDARAAGERRGPAGASK